MEIQFKKATKQAAKLRLSIAGPSGSGKTYTALAIGTALGDRVAVIDTEHGSASKYADLFEFDVLELEAPYHPDRYVQAMTAAAAAGYNVLVVDSLSQAWSGAGGLLEIVDQIAARMKTSNSFAAWKDATPIHNRLIEAIISTPVHIIATMRSKQEYVLEDDNRGRKVPRKIGMAPVQRDGMEYEFDVFAEMDMENRMLIQKTRCPALAGRVIDKPTGAVADELAAWLAGSGDGVDTRTPSVAPAPQYAERLVDLEKSVNETDPVDFMEHAQKCKAAVKKWPAKWRDQAEVVIQKAADAYTERHAAIREAITSVNEGVDRTEALLTLSNKATKWPKAWREFAKEKFEAQFQGREQLFD